MPSPPHHSREDDARTREELLAEVARLRAQLAEPEETLAAIRQGEVDALVVAEPAGERIYLLKEADRLFRLVVEEMREGAAVLTPAGDVLYANRRLAEMLRREAPALAGASFQGFVSGEARPLFDALLRVAERGSARSEIALIAADGACVPAYLAVNGLAPEGFPGFCVIATDLSDQARRQELLAVENLAGSILEQSRAALVVCDEAGLVLRVNAAASRLAAGDPLLCPFAEAFPLALAGGSGGAPPLAEVLAGASLAGAEARLERGGESFDLLVSAGPWRDAQGDLLGTLWNLIDITAIKAAEADLRRAKREAEAASQAKDRFLATLSHEMRTPLTPVLAVLSELLRPDGEVLPADLAANLRMIQRNVELEARLIDDVLDLARVARGAMELDRRAFDLGQVVEHAAAICRTPEVAARGIALEVDLEAGALPAWGDPARLTQVVWNLVRNALKFTPDGGRVAVRCFQEPHEPQEPGAQGAPGHLPRRLPGHLVIEVADRGIGIDPELLPRLFDPFEQGEERGFGRPGQGGLGLGLAISKTIVDLHGGRLSAESAGAGRGATFRVELPGEVPEAAAGTEHEREDEPDEGRGNGRPAAPSAARILLVEDHPDSAEALAHLLATLGYQVAVATSVAEALAADWSAVDVLVSDLGLPDGSGLDLLAEVRRRRPHLPIRAIALSGYGMESDRARSREAGFQVHLVKPTDLASLESAIRQLLRAG